MAWPWSALIVVGLGLAVAAVAVAALVVVTRALCGREQPDRLRDRNLLSSSNGQVLGQHEPRSPDHGRGS